MYNLSKAEAAASEIISDWDIKNPSEIDVEAFAYERNFIICRKPLKSAQARLLILPPFCSLTLNTDITNKGQIRFAIAHELGHYELHYNNQSLLLINDEDIFNVNQDSKIESEANSFASELLMPSSLFSSYCQGHEPDFSLIQYIAKEFNTSITATAFKYVNFTTHPCALIVSENKIIKWRSFSDDFPYKNEIVKKGDFLKEDAFAYDLYSGNVQEKPELISASSWFESYPEHDIEIHEHSLYLKSYNTVLSLLWVD